MRGSEREELLVSSRVLLNIAHRRFHPDGRPIDGVFLELELGPCHRIACASKACLPASFFVISGA